MIKKGFIEITTEGEGTKDDVVRQVYYVYDEDLNLLGKIDEWIQQRLLHRSSTDCAFCLCTAIQGRCQGCLEVPCDCSTRNCEYKRSA
jgi:hypothetical protein